MFAQNDQSTKRRIAGYLGGVLGAACVLLAVYPGLAAGAAAAPALDKLTLTSVCTLPKGDAVLRVDNPNALAVSYTWDIRTTSFAGKGLAPAGAGFLHVPPSTAGTTRLFVNGALQSAKKQNEKTCVLHVVPMKRWVDASGTDVDGPAVPKGWKLTLDSDLETLICTWKKEALSCKSKVDIEDRGEFANEKPNLDVPFGGSYTITETSTSDFKQEGTGKFGPLDPPKDLDAYFEGDDSVVAVVTNHLVGEAAPSTTAEETTTTTEAPTSTVAAQDEPTTVADDEPTTTLAEEPTTSLVEDTTTTEAPATTLFIAPQLDDPTTTVEDTTTAAPETTRSPSTTLAPADPADDTTTSTAATSTTSTTSTTSASTTAGATAASVDPGDSPSLDDLAVRGTDLGSGVEPASDTLPVTGAATISVAATGLLLLVAGLVILAIGRRRSVS